MGAASRLMQQRQLEWQSNRSFEIKKAVPNKVLVFMPAANPEDFFVGKQSSKIIPKQPTSLVKNQS
jgi:hypothetical protein